VRNARNQIHYVGRVISNKRIIRHKPLKSRHFVRARQALEQTVSERAAHTAVAILEANDWLSLLLRSMARVKMRGRNHSR
jgi:hypothetical protein